MSKIKNTTAQSSANTDTTETSFDDMSIEQLNALIEARNARLAAIQQPLDAELKAKFAECAALANKIKAFNPYYSAPWDVVTHGMLGYSIRCFLKKKGGTAKRADILKHHSAFKMDVVIKDLLAARSVGDSRHWDYDEEADTYTLKPSGKNNN